MVENCVQIFVVEMIRKLSEDEYNDWAELHNRAEQALEKRDKLLMESYNRY